MDGPLGKVVNGVIEGKSVDFWTLSRFIWEHPELALNEVEAHAKLTEFLEQRDFRVQREYLLSTAFRAEFDAPGGTDGPTIAFLCEYDALPDIGHACGHNLIAELAVASAVAVRDAMKHSHDLRGQVGVSFPTGRYGSSFLHVFPSPLTPFSVNSVYYSPLTPIPNGTKSSSCTRSCKKRNIGAGSHGI